MTDPPESPGFPVVREIKKSDPVSTINSLKARKINVAFSI